MTLKNPEQWLCLTRVVRFGDTDAAGVMHFHQLLRWCHESWEESLDRYGLPVSDIFPNCNDQGNTTNMALPIIHCEADFRSPIRTGDRLSVELSPEKIDVGSFQVKARFQREGEDVALGLIRHVAINAHNRQRCSLPEGIDRWLEASSIRLGLRSV